MASSAGTTDQAVTQFVVVHQFVCGEQPAEEATPVTDHFRPGTDERRCGSCRGRVLLSSAARTAVHEHYEDWSLDPHDADVDVEHARPDHFWRDGRKILVL